MPVPEVTVAMAAAPVTAAPGTATPVAAMTAMTPMTPMTPMPPMPPMPPMRLCRNVSRRHHQGRNTRRRKTIDRKHGDQRQQAG